MKMLLTSLLFFLLFLSATAAENLVRNPSFEQRNAQGKAFAWSVSPPHWELDSSIHLSGTSSLRYTNLDPKTYRYAYCRQTVKVEPGKSYRFGGKVRYSGVRNGYADICLEIIGKNGRVLKGYYPHGPKAFTTEWLEINGMAISIPQDFSSAHIACYAQRYTFGTIWFDDIFLEETEVPLLTRFTSSAYRNITDGGTVTFFIGTNRPVKPEELSQAGLSFTFAGKTSPLKALRTKILPDMLVYEVNTADLPFGRMTVDFRVVGKDGPAEKSLVFEKVKKLPLRKAGIDKNQRFILDGRPFFPLGLYLPVHPLPEEDIKTIAESDINTVLPYAELDAGNLDLMKKYNLNVIYNLKDAAIYSRSIDLIAFSSPSYERLFVKC